MQHCLFKQRRVKMSTVESKNRWRQPR